MVSELRLSSTIDPSMASSSSSVSFPSFNAPNLTPLVSIKLESSNYLLWVSQFLPILRSHDLMGMVDGTDPCPPKFHLDEEGKETTTINPDFAIWQKKDQYLLSWLNATLTENVLSSVYGLNTSQKVWNLLASWFASHSRS